MPAAPSRLRLRGAVGWAGLVAAVAGYLPMLLENAGWATGWFVVALLGAGVWYLTSGGWRLPWWWHAIAFAPAVSALIPAIVGWEAVGASRFSRYAYAAVLALAGAAWARDAVRRTAVGVAVSTLLVVEFLWAWFPWWGSGDPTTLMIGTFYWHNQFGVFMAAGVAATALIAVLRTGAPAMWAAAAGAFATTGALSSGSRAAIALTVAALIVALVLGVRRRRWVGAARWAVLVVGAVIVAALMRSPFAFAASGGWSVPTENVTQRGSLDSSWVARLDHWRVAVEMGADSFWSGAGLMRYGVDGVCYARTTFTSNPHSEVLLAWAESGVFAALALATAIIALAVVVVRRVIGDGLLSRRRAPEVLGGALAAAVLLAHLFVDFDAAWAGLTGWLGWMSGLALSGSVRVRTSSRPVRIAVAVAVVAVVAVAVLLVLVDPHATNPLLMRPADAAC